MRLEILTPPAIEPVTLAEFKRYARVWADLTDDDVLINNLITAAREVLERRTARAFIEQILVETRTIPDDGRLRLLRAPVQEVQSVVVDGIAVDGPNLEGPATLLLGRAGQTAVVTYKAGFGPAAADVPQSLRIAVMVLATHFHDQRATSEEIPPLVATLCSTFSWGGEGPPR